MGLNTTRSVDKRSIGIEIASEGALLARDGKFYAFGQISDATKCPGPVYDCAAMNLATGGELRLASATAEPAFLWRDYRYFAEYAPAALAAVSDLVNHLFTLYSIPRQTPANHVDLDLPAYTNYKGVLTHCQLRSDKSDVHPGFAWDDLVKSCGLQLTGAPKSHTVVAVAAKA